MSALKFLPVALALLSHLASAGVTSLKDGAAVDKFCGKQDVALIEFFNEKEATATPDDLTEAARKLEFSDAVFTARVAGTEEIVTKFELVGDTPIIKLFIKGKAFGSDFDGDRAAETSASDIAAWARAQAKEARAEGVLKEKGEVEELKSSRKDRLCFTAEGICAIYLANGKASTEEISLLTKLKKKNTSKLSTGTNARGTTFNWSWLDATAEPGFKELLNGDSPTLPGMIIYNPHKRPRSFALEEGTAADEDSIQELLDKLLGGDARFKAAQGGNLPSFAAKEKEAKEDQSNEDL